MMDDPQLPAHHPRSTLGLPAEPETGDRDVQPGASPPDDALLTTPLAPDALAEITTRPAAGNPSPPGRFPVPPGYVLGEPLGSGGMGVVFRGTQIALNRSVAIKYLRPESFHRPGAVVRFRAEAEAIARVQHPNIVQVFEAGETEGWPFLALELVTGGTLADRLAEGPLPPTVAAELSTTIAAAVEAAHRVGIIHRDLKPANVLLTPDRVPKVTDFGLSKSLATIDEQPHRGGYPTQTGAVLGTPAYMAPEQADSSRDVGAAADVYALGAILYECLTGRPPFRAASVMETLDLVRKADPVPPRRLVPGVPRDLETICLRCLHKSASRRYSSAAALAEDLQRFLTGRPVVARPIGWTERAVKLARRNPGVTALVGLLVVVGCVGFALVLWQWSEAVHNAALAQRHEREASQRAEGEARANADAQQRAKAEARARDEAEASLYQSRLVAALAEWQQGNLSDARRQLAECPPSRRQWEWNLLARVCQPPPPLLTGDGSLLFSLGGDAEGGLVALSGAKTVLTVIDTKTRQPVFRLPPPSDNESPLYQPIFADGGKSIVAAKHGTNGANWTVVEFDAATGSVRRQRPVATMGRPSVTLCPNGVAAAVIEVAPAARAGHLTVQDARTGEARFTVRAHPGEIAFYPLFDRTGRLVVTGGRDGFVRLWDAKTGDLKGEIDTKDTELVEAAVAPGGELAATCGQSGVRVWETATGRERFRFPTIAVPATQMRFTNDGRLAALWHLDGLAVRVWDASTGREVGRYRADQSVVDLLHVTRDGKGLLLIGETGDVRRWDGWGSPDSRSLNSTEGFTAIEFAGDGRLVAGGGGMGEDGYQVTVWETATGNKVARLAGATQTIHGLAFDRMATRVAAASADGKVRVWNLPRADRQVEFDVVGGPVMSRESVSQVRFHDDRTLMTIRKDGAVQLWDSTTGEYRQTLYYAGAACCVGLNSAGNRAVFCFANGRVEWVDLQQGKVTARIDRPGRIAAIPTISPDGRRLLLAEAFIEGMLEGVTPDFPLQNELWDTDGNRMLNSWPTETDSRFGLFTPDGRRLIMPSGRDRRPMVFDAATGRPLLTFLGYPTVASTGAISSNGHWLAMGTNLASTGPQNRLYLFDARPLGEGWPLPRDR